MTEFREFLVVLSFLNGFSRCALFGCFLERMKRAEMQICRPPK
jgi:hypothetical protein